MIDGFRYIDDCDTDVSLMIFEIDDGIGNNGCGPAPKRADNP